MAQGGQVTPLDRAADGQHTATLSKRARGCVPHPVAPRNAVSHPAAGRQRELPGHTNVPAKSVTGKVPGSLIFPAHCQETPSRAGRQNPGGAGMTDFELAGRHANGE